VSNLGIGLLSLGSAILLIGFGLPIGIALGGVAILGILAVVGPNAALGIMKSAPYELAASWELSAVPMFILMGTIAYHSGMTRSLFYACRVWLGRLPGGLAVATNFACAGFAAASGSSLATTIAMGRLAIPEMRRYGYDPGLATGVVAAAGTLGSLIPPSILMVIYGVFAEVSIPKLFIAGILPGLLTAVAYMIMIVVRCRLNPALAPAPESAVITWAERWSALIAIWPLPVLIVGVIGSIYSGIATPTEAGAVGAVLASLISILRGEFTFAILYESLKESILSSAAIFFIAIGAVLLTRLMAYSGVPNFLAQLIGDWSVDPVLLILATTILYLVLGALIDPIGMIFLTLPILIPMYRAAGLDMVWFGILLIKFVEIGLITPPVGLNVFAVKTMNPDIPLGKIFAGVSWFLLAELFVLALLIVFPQISLVLVAD
jgi:tripartite ATP-independent transporter DctM subunit